MSWTESMGRRVLAAQNKIRFSVGHEVWVWSLLQLSKENLQYIPVALIQSCKHTRASTVSAVIRLRKSDSTLDPVLNADSDAIVEAGTANISLAIRLNVGYSSELICHQARILNCSLRWIGTFDKYDSRTGSKGNMLVPTCQRIMAIYSHFNITSLWHWI